MTTRTGWPAWRVMRGLAGNSPHRVQLGEAMLGIQAREGLDEGELPHHLGPLDRVAVIGGELVGLARPGERLRDVAIAGDAGAGDLRQDVTADGRAGFGQGLPYRGPG